MLTDMKLLEALPHAVYTTDAAGHITFYNQAAADLWGCRPEIGTSQWCGSWRLYWPDGRPMAHDECPMAVTLREGRPVRGAEAIAERPDGTRIAFAPYPTPLKDASGKVVGGINLLVDITAERSADIELARLAAIVSSSDDAIVSKTLDGRVTSWNAGATRIFGYEASEMIGQSITKIIPPDLLQEEKEIISKLSRGEYIAHYETVRLAKNGRRVDISLAISPLRDKFGSVIGASKVARDITAKRQADKIQHLMIEELNHRVRNTLATIQAIASQSLRRSKDPADFVSGFTGRIQALAKAYQTLSETKLQGAHVGDLVHEQVGITKSDGRITASGPLVVLVPQSAIQLALVLHELATNARKHGALSVPDGRLSIKWEVRTNGAKELLLRWEESGGPAVTAPPASDYSASLIEQTLKAQGGQTSIRYSSNGLVCEIQFPLPREDYSGIALFTAQTSTPEMPGMAPAQSPNPTIAGKRILVIEDEPLVAMEMEAILEEAGCEVAGLAGNLVSAKRLVTEGRYEVALVDVNLAGEPVHELAAALREKRIPFAFVTGYGREALPAGFQDAVMLGKPFLPEDLISTVQKVTAAAAAPAGVLPFARPNRRRRDDGD
jgi:PAS domain S-box-containing protein